MTSIIIVPEDISRVATKVEINLMTVDLYNNSMYFDVLVKTDDGSVIKQVSLSPPSTDFANFIDLENIKSFILESLDYVEESPPA